MFVRDTHFRASASLSIPKVVPVRQSCNPPTPNKPKEPHIARCTVILLARISSIPILHLIHPRPECSILSLQIRNLLILRADMFDRAVKDLAFTWFDSLASLAFGTVRASARQSRNGQAELVEVRIEILAISPFNGCMWDALPLATTVAWLAWYVFIVVIVTGFQSGTCHARPVRWKLV